MPPRQPMSVVSTGNPEGLPIGRIEILPRNIFDPLPNGRLQIFFRLANRLHIRTRQRTIRDQLLFEPGDRWYDALGHETGRNLRRLNFLQPDHIDAQRVGDSVYVKVVTRDVWSTRPEFNIESADGRHYGSIAFTELNFAGLGKGLSVAYRELPDGTSRSFSYSDPSVQGTRVRLRYGASNGTTGASDEVSIGQPYFAEDAARTYGISWGRSTSVFTLYENAREAAHFDRRNEDVEVYWGVGRKARGLVRRARVMVWASDLRFGPSVLAGPGVAPEFGGDEENLRLRRLGVEGQLWRPDHIERTRVDGFGLVEDYDVGSSLEARLAFASDGLGSSQDEAFFRGRLRTGFELPGVFGLFDASLSSRLQTILIDTILNFDGRIVQQSSMGQTFVFAAHGIAGSNVTRDFQAVVGGLNGLRAYPVHAVAGTRLWRLNAENRWTVGENFWENVTIGGVVFADAARAWGPGSGASKWFLGLGTGLRVTLPQWSLGQVMRFDVAWPVEPSRDGRRNPVLSFGSSQAF